MKIIISRTDKIGDVILTLPLAGIIKANFPDAYIYFLGRTYTKHVIDRSIFIDQFINWDLLKTKDDLPNADYFIHVFPNKEIAQLANTKKIAHRIGTSHRIFHWWTCNHRIDFTRKNSSLHEAQLNTKLLLPVGIENEFTIEQLAEYTGWKKGSDPTGADLLSSKFNLILHTKSMGSAKEWPLERYLQVVEKLPKDNFQIFISGTKQEGELIRTECPLLFDLENVTDTTGMFTLKDFISFIEKCDGLLACSTGPLHIASAAGIHCLGLYPSRRPMDAGRWGPIGKRSGFLAEKSENDSKFLNIEVDDVVSILKQWKKF